MIAFVKKNSDKIDTVFKAAFLLLVLATFNTFIYLSPVQPLLVKISLGLGVIAVLFRVITYNRYIRMPFWILLAAFCVSFVVSIFLNRKYGMAVSDFKWVIWSGLLFFMLYVCNTDREVKEYKREFRLLTNIMIIYSVLAAIVSLVLMLCMYSDIAKNDSGEVLISGFTWGRLWGVYTDPNYGGAFSAIAIILCVYFIINNKNKLIRSMYIAAIIFNYAYIIFSDSRTAELSIIIGIICFLFLYHTFKKTALKKRLLYCIIAIIISAVSLLGNSVIKTEYNAYVTKVSKKIALTDKEKAEKKKSQAVGRKADIESDVTNGRTALWLSGIEVWKNKPIFGTGYNSFTSVAREYEPETYVVNNTQGEYTSLHNAYINVLVYQGISGFAIMILFMILMAVYAIRKMKKVRADEASYIAVLSTCVVMVAASMMFLLEGIYTNSPGSFILWGFAGYLVHYFYKQKEAEQ